MYTYTLQLWYRLLHRKTASSKLVVVVSLVVFYRAVVWHRMIMMQYIFYY